MKKKIFFRFILALVILVFAVIVLPMTYMYLTEPREYAYRELMWNESDIYDYEKFPYREILIASPVYHFKENLTPSLFQTVEYKRGGKVQSADFEDFMTRSGTTAFIVVQDANLLYENYFNGFQRDGWFTSFSTAKSIISALVGIAVDEGLIDDINDPFVKYLPELAGRGLDKMTIKHLLTMSCGYQFTTSESYFYTLSFLSDEAKAYYYPDLRALIQMKLRPGKQEVGSCFLYNDYAPVLEGLILERVTGMTVSAYLQEKIWRPLGMEYPARFSIDSQASGFEKMSADFNARAIDYAKFGQLFLKKGNWNGKQIISEAWVKESTTVDSTDQRPWLTYDDFRQEQGYYKYHWWGKLRENGLFDYMAIGHLNEYIFIRPDQNLVIIRLGTEKGPDVNWPQVFQSMADKIKE
jgi:CubicO group peptidase (beta-lactamase class C family)